MNAAIIVVTHNSEGCIGAFLERLVTHAEGAIVVVDNASSDDTVRIVREKGCAVYVNQQNAGFAAAANQGAKTVPPTTPYLVFANPDTQLQTADVLALTTYLAEHPQVGIVAPLLVADATGEPEKHCFGDRVTLQSLLQRQRTPQRVPADSASVGWVSGGVLCIRTSTFRDVRGFDDQFFLYWEDVDLCERVRQLGQQVVICPPVQVPHSRGHSPITGPQRTRHYDQSADRYFRKHYAYPIWIAQRWFRRLYRYYSPQAD